MNTLLKNISIAFIFLVASLSTTVMASHLVGGELFYECLGNNKYKITMKIYRDCGGTGAPFDPQAKVGIFEGGTGNMITTMLMTFPGSTQVPVNDANGCFTLPPNLCLEEAIYIDSITLPPNATGYNIVYQRCCRNPTIVNLDNPGAAGSTYVSFIPPQDTFCNSSPSFNNFPPVVLCINDVLTFDHSATDLDGDSLVYEFARPYHGGTSANPAPNPSPPPFANTVWGPGFSDTYQLSTSPAISLNSSTGLLTGTPNAVGQYVVCIIVKEYRNGVYISETRRDFQFNVVNCNKAIAAVADQQVFCNDLTVQFQNNSFNGTSFFWDFGETGVSTDTSSVNSPTYTYTDSGVFTVMLVADPGSVCADTAFSTFRVFPNITPNYVKPSNQCFANNSFSFTAGGSYEPSTSITWDFGSNGNPSTLSGPNPTGVNFSTVGDQVITVTYDDFGCTKQYVDSVKILESPIVAFTPDTNEICQYRAINFLNQSTVDSNNTYLWNFGDGTFSQTKNPSHLYNSSGSYDVKLIAVSKSGCKDSLNMPNAINVIPGPRAGFSPLESEVFIFNPVVNFFETTSDATTILFSTGDSTQYTTFGNIIHEYLTVGNYTVTQIVSNDFGCSDTLSGFVKVKSGVFFYVPNSFTPNGDGINDIFLPQSLSIDKYDFKIFDRWGRVVFQTTNPREGWDGKIRGKEDGKIDIYQYLAKFTDSEGEKHVYMGHVSLIR